MKLEALRKKCEFVRFLNFRVQSVEKWTDGERKEEVLNNLRDEIRKQSAIIDKYISLFDISAYSFADDIIEYFRDKKNIELVSKIDLVKKMNGQNNNLYWYQLKLVEKDFSYEFVLIPNLLFEGKYFEGELVTPRVNLLTEGYITKVGSSSPLHFAKSMFSDCENLTWAHDIDEAVWYSVERNIKRKIRSEIDQTDKSITLLKSKVVEEKRRLRSLQVEKIKPALTNIDCLIK